MPRSAGNRGNHFVIIGRSWRASSTGTAPGVAWRDLPQECGPWTTLWKRHRRLAGDGTWDKVLAVLLTALGRLGWQASVDSAVDRAHQHITNLTRAEGGTGGRVESQDTAGGAG